MKIFIFRFLISIFFMLLCGCYASTYVSLTPVLTEIIYALDGQDNLLGVSSVCNYPDDVKNKEIIGDTYFVNMEKIINLKPDYLFAMTSNKPLLGQLSLTKTKLVDFEFANVDEIYQGIKKIGKIINKEENAKKLISQIENEINANKTKNPKKILYIVQIDPLITIGNKSYINDLIEKSGNISLTSNISFAYPSITYEYILKTNPDVIFVMYENNINFLKKVFPNTKIITLSKAQQDIINRPGPRIPEAIKIFTSF